MPHKTIKQEWDDYARRVLPADAPSAQVIECRRAFYAGNFSLLMLLKNSLNDNNISEEDGVEMLKEWEREHHQFYDDMMAGKA